MCTTRLRKIFCQSLSSSSSSTELLSSLMPIRYGATDDVAIVAPESKSPLSPLDAISISIDDPKKIIHPDSIEDLEDKGQYLGEGSYGIAYKVKNQVYKVYHLGPPDLPERNARYWNQAYTHLYNGKYKSYATASHLVLPWGEHGKNCNVLVTPYISGTNSQFSCPSYHAYLCGCHCCLPPVIQSFRQEMQACSLVMLDSSIPGNVKILEEDQVPVPIDFDMVGSFSAEPVSPRSSTFATQYPALFYVREKPKTPPAPKISAENSELRSILIV